MAVFCSLKNNATNNLSRHTIFILSILDTSVSMFCSEEKLIHTFIVVPCMTNFYHCQLVKGSFHADV